MRPALLLRALVTLTLLFSIAPSSIGISLAAWADLGDQSVGWHRLPDGGIRRRLEGCWMVADIDADICFDGSDRTEVTVGSSTHHGTYTVMSGRVFFDLSGENPHSETYASCAVAIPPELKLGEELSHFALTSCAHWDVLSLPVEPPSDHSIEAVRTERFWLMDELYRGGGNSAFHAPLRGCWTAQMTRDRMKTVEEMTKEFGGWLAAYDICFSGNRSGATVQISCDAFDCWEDGGRFRMVNGWLDLDAYRCQIVVNAETMSWSRCALWAKGRDGRMVPIHAEEPTTFKRTGDTP